MFPATIESSYFEVQQWSEENASSVDCRFVGVKEIQITKSINARQRSGALDSCVEIFWVLCLKGNLN